MFVAPGVPLGLCWSLMRRHDLAPAERGLGAAAALLSVVKKPSLAGPLRIQRIPVPRPAAGSPRRSSRSAVLGRDHALLGAVAGVGLAEPVARLAHTHLPPGQVAAAGAICAGFALLPDIDEPGSTVSRRLGPVSEAVAAVTNKLAGGHRKATHSLWFAGGTAALVWWLGQFALAAPILVYACLALTLTMLVPGRPCTPRLHVALIGPVAAGMGGVAGPNRLLDHRPDQGC